MSLPNEAGTILKSAYPQADSFSWMLRRTPDGVVLSDWSLAGEAQPTEQQINDWATDATPLPSGQLFSEWKAENGSDMAKTRRRQAKEQVDAADGDGVRIRALIELMNKRDNYLLTRIKALQEALDSAKSSTGNVQNLRDALPSVWANTRTRTKSQAIQEFKDDIAVGNQDD